MPVCSTSSAATSYGDRKTGRVRSPSYQRQVAGRVN